MYFETFCVSTDVVQIGKCNVIIRSWDKTGVTDRNENLLYRRYKHKKEKGTIKKASFESRKPDRNGITAPITTHKMLTITFVNYCIVLLIIVTESFANPVLTKDEEFTIRIVHTNDMHARWSYSSLLK